MAFELPDLPYAHDALADLGMSKETLEYHHDIHHKAYVDNDGSMEALVLSLLSSDSFLYRAKPVSLAKVSP